MIAVISFADAGMAIEWLARRTPVANTRFDFIGHKGPEADGDPTTTLIFDCGDGPVSDSIDRRIALNIADVYGMFAEAEVHCYDSRDDLPVEDQESL